MQGGCLCGEIRYEITGPVVDLGHCHCSMCRKAHGTGFATYGQVAKDDFRFTAGADRLRPYPSSPEVVRSFCSRCGSNLTFAHSALSAAIFVAAGTLDDDPGVRPSHHIFVASKAPWVTIDDELPQHAAYPETES